MQGPTTQFKRDLLRGIAWDAADAAQTLEAALKAAVRGQIQNISGGLSLVSVAGNGQSFTYALPAAASTLSPETVALACGQLYDLYIDSSAALTAAGETVNDSTVLAEMLSRLSPRQITYADRSRARLPA